MKSGFHPFRKPTVNPDATGKLDAAMADLIARGGFPAGATLAAFARQWGVEARSLRWRCTRAGMATPGATRAREEAGGGEPVTLAEAGGGEPVTLAEAGGGVELEKLILDGIPEGGEKSESVYNIQSVCTSPGIQRDQIPVLQAPEVDRHDEEVARLVRDSLEAFRKGRSKGPGGRKVIPIQKVSDITALDTLFRRATRQGERSGETSARPVLNIQFLGGVSRESVRAATDDTSRIVDVEGEDLETRPR
jgi:hypothetical protein